MGPGETEKAYYEGGLFFKPGFGAAEWEALKQRLPIGSIISGKVAHQARFGVFIDTDLGFPALAEIPSFGFRGIRFPEDYPGLLSSISGKISGFNEDNRQIRLSDSSVIIQI